jgi:hypothetical protein
LGEKRKAYRILVENSEETTKRPAFSWVDNFKMDLKSDSVGWYGLD